MWRRPPGVAPGTWHYVHQRSIADHYDAFVEAAAVCRLDSEILTKVLPGVSDPATRPETVLDLGCGTGRTALPLARRGYHVIAIDLSEPMLAVLNQKIAAETTSGTIYPIKANLVDLGGIADGQADHAVCLFATMGMVQGRANRRAAMRHIGRIVRPGGSLVIHVHNRWAALSESGGYQSLARSWWNSIRKRDTEFGDATYAYRGLRDMFMHRFSRRELTSDLKASGWKIDDFLRLAIEGDRLLGDDQGSDAEHPGKSKGGFVAGGFIVVATRTPAQS